MKHLTPTETQQFLQQVPEALFIDVRSEIEYFFVGHPSGAEHISWSDGPDWEINPDFAHEVRRLAGDGLDRPVVLICRSGHRSVEAGQVLEAAGFTEVINVLYGFEGERDENYHRNTRNGWRVDGLPWEQS
jgi:rhodanese-related sulfurtransferase